MITCGTCVHWEEPDEFMQEFYKPDGGPEGPAWGHCLLARSVDGEPKNLNTLAFALDSEEYSARLNTRADFGCVQHEPKEKQ